MSINSSKLKKPTLKVMPSSRTMNGSVSGMRRVNRSTAHKSFSLAADSKVMDKMQIQRQKIQVFDELGKDVTPQALFQPEPGVPQAKLSRVFANDTSAGTASDFLYQTITNASFSAPTRSIFGSSIVSRSSLSTMESMTEEIEDPSYKRDTSISLTDVQVRREEVKEHLREDMLDVVVNCYISETDTISHLDMSDVIVSEDADDAEAIKERSNIYVEICKNRIGNDAYVERSMQTFNGAPKSKEVQTDNVAQVDAATSATAWDMYDTFCGGEQGEAGLTPDADKAAPQAIMDASRGPEKTMSVVSSTSLATGSSSQTEMETFVAHAADETNPELILQSESFQQSLLVMERTILQNIFQTKLATYRQLPMLEDTDSVGKTKGAGQREEHSESPLTPALERLWAFSCELTVGRNVSSMAWNKKNPDILAVGYGQFDFKEQKSGLVCCWSLKNPTWPERIFHCESGVTALDFSGRNASQLAVGMHDGSIASYNVQSQEKTPIIDSSECADKHTSPVWQVKWIEQENGLSGDDKGEALISVSADGRISTWFMHKGLSCIDLMKLKRTHDNKAKKQLKDKDRNTLISRLTPGLCFDFHPAESNIYLAGTEDGQVHKCSCSYHEQVLETYRGHKGPLYRITWSPFCPDVFLSCSSDWTIQMWRQDLLTPVLVFTSAQRAVYDVTWSPKWASVFGAVNEGGIEIWDLGSSILDPTIVYLAGPGVTLTSLLFATQTDCILVGDSNGQVGVYKLRDLAVGEGNQVNTLENIIGSTLASQL